ncbi:hypothetical protein BM477_06505 [Boudabousia marimammalium]|uniref:ABC transporter domain-containing protein n=1 Tax=Boudabousia marimammalium TaxID=156892 RepID=A0A1Q5PM47_9ACTO|nr:hypothetical protein BM477_06505 [Boudabousia marimammalium]
MGRGGWLTKSSRQAVPVLKDINLTIEPGHKIALIGPSGCGKSTLLALISGLLAPDSGQLKISGESVDSFAGQVALMPQRDALFDWLTVQDNVALPAKIAGVSREVRRQQALELLRQFHLDQVATAWPAELSGGMRSRVAFLRTMLTRRPVLALDEPFGALDALTREDLQQWLTGVVDEQGLTLVMVTHDVDEAVLLADQVLVMGRAPGGIRAQIDTSSVNLAAKNTVSAANQQFVQLRSQVRAALSEAAQNTPN